MTATRYGLTAFIDFLAHPLAIGLCFVISSQALFAARASDTNHSVGVKELQARTLAWAQDNLSDSLIRSANLSRIEFFASKMDSRLNLSRCDQPLEFEPPQNAARSHRLLIKTRCSGSKPWAIFVPLKIRRWQQAVLAKTPITRATVIDTPHIELGEIELPGGRHHFYTDINQVVGSIAKRNIGAGSPLTANNTKPAKLVHRGDQVTIIAQAGGVQVKMNGLAMSDGLKDQQIQVKNLSSKRLIKARVIEAGKVAVVM